MKRRFRSNGLNAHAFGDAVAIAKTAPRAVLPAATAADWKDSEFADLIAELDNKGEPGHPVTCQRRCCASRSS